MTNSDKAIADFLAKGGKVTQVKEGVTSNDSNDFVFNSLSDCSCGCKGNYTDHQMRKGERGQY